MHREHLSGRKDFITIDKSRKLITYFTIVLSYIKFTGGMKIELYSKEMNLIKMFTVLTSSVCTLSIEDLTSATAIRTSIQYIH